MANMMKGLKKIIAKEMSESGLHFVEGKEHILEDKITPNRRRFTRFSICIMFFDNAMEVYIPF